MKIRGTTQLFNPPTSPIFITDGQGEDGLTIPGPAGATGPQGPAGPSGSGGGGQQGLMPVDNEPEEPLIVLASNLAYLNKPNSGSLSASLGFYERNRTTALGELVSFTPTLVSLNNTTVDGTWSGGSVDCRYTLVGPKLVYITLDFENTSISSGTANVLRVSSIPVTFGTETNSNASWFRSSWTQDALVQMRNATTNIDITRGGGVAWGAGAFFLRYAVWAVTQ